MLMSYAAEKEIHKVIMIASSLRKYYDYKTNS